MVYTGLHLTKHAEIVKLVFRMGGGLEVTTSAVAAGARFMRFNINGIITLMSYKEGACTTQFMRLDISAMVCLSCFIMYIVNI